MNPTVNAFFDPETWTLSYAVWDESTRDALLIDPVWDYDPNASKLSRKSADTMIRFAREKRLNVHYIVDTHAHADHLTGSQLVKKEFPQAKVAIGGRIRLVQETFGKLYNLGSDFKADGTQFDLLVEDEQLVKAGSLSLRALYTPGHTPACSSWQVGNTVFTGDALFMPDYGTGRCDFPGGSAETLYDSITRRLYTLPPETRVFVGHDYQPNGREVRWETTIGEEKASNIQLRGDTQKDAFVRFRTERDKTLKAPRLLLPSLQVNIRAGHLPPRESNGTAYLKLPLFEE